MGGVVESSALVVERDSLKRVLAQVVAQVLRPDGEIDFLIPRQAEGLLEEACRLSGIPWRWVDPDPQGLARDLRRVAARLKADGYESVQWDNHPRGVRAKRPGKISIPSHDTKSAICLTHGNLVKNGFETYPGEPRGICVLSVAPCLFCHPDAPGPIRRTPRPRRDGR